MTSKIESYACDICGDSYDRLSEAKRCEEIGFITPQITSGAVFLSYRKASCYTNVNSHRPTTSKIKLANKTFLQDVYNTLGKSMRIEVSDLDRNELGVYVFLYKKGIKKISRHGGMFRGHFPEMRFHETMIEDPPFKKYKVYFAGRFQHDGFSINDKRLINLEEITSEEFKFIYPLLKERYEKLVYDYRYDYQNITHRYGDFTVHIGRKADLLSKYSEVQNLRIALEMAIDKEEYEKAAYLKNEIAKIEETTKKKKNS